MTVSLIPAASLPGAAALPATTAGPAAGAISFAESFLSLLERALDAPEGDQRRLAGGTMRSSVEMFDQRGFFEDRALAGGDPADAAAMAAPAGTAAGGAMGLDRPLVSDAPPGGARGEPVSIPMPPSSPRPVLASDSPAANGLHGGSASGATMTAAASPPLASAAPALSSVVAPKMPPLLDRGGIASSEEGPGPVAPERDDASMAASRMKVSLVHEDDGVTISVVADTETDADRGVIHDAVSHLLARHGLVLRELRVTRRPGAGSQDRTS